MRTTVVRNLLGGSGLALWGIVAPSYAQTGAGVDEIEDILVTARRVEERLEDVPISMTVYNQQQLSDRNIVNAADLATFTPSLSANSNFGSDNSSYAIRGFVQDLGTAPSVGVYFADVVAPRGASNGFPTGNGTGAGAFFDLQNVQVLKGPQGTLFGRNTTGGAVLLVPQRPTEQLEGYVQASAGNYDMQRMQGVLNVPLGETARLRLGVDRQKRDGYLENTSGVGPEDFVDVDYAAYRASFAVDLTPALENYTVLTYTDSGRNGDFQKLVAADPAINLGFFAAQQLAEQAASGNGGFFEAQQDLSNPQSDLEQWQIINTTTWQIDEDLTLKNILSYGELTQDLRSAMFGTAFTTPAIAPLNLPSYRFGFSSIQALPGGHTTEQWTSTEELRLEGASFDNALTWQTGAYFELSEPDSAGGSQSPVVISCTSVADFECTDILGFLTMFATGSYAPVGTVNYTAGETDYRDIGLYAQATYQLNEEFSVTGGVRYTWDRERNTSTQRTYQFNPPLDPATFAPLPPQVSAVFCTYPDAPADCTRKFTQRSDEPTWLIDFDYTPNDETLLYAKYARGYRAGATFANISPPFNLVRPERVDAYEIGSKLTFDGDISGAFNTAIFYNDFENQQLQLGFQDNPTDNVTVTPTAGPINAGESEIYGIELEAVIVPLEGLRISAGYTYLHTKINSIETFVLSPSSPFVVDGQQRAGDELALSPENKYTISAQYTLPLDDSLGRVTVGADFVHTDEQLSNYADRNLPDPEIRGLGTLPDTDILNVNLNWDSIAGSTFDLLIFGTNVTDEKYYAFVPGLATGTGFETAVLGQPRMYGVQLTYRFGRD
jgi:iron complex outermembrane receptor protein